MNKPKIIVICGPTASGKTALSIELAKKIDGEIVSADSMQIYEDMDIGTAKPTMDEMSGIKHYLIGNVSPTIRYSVANYKKDAISAIEEILQKGKTPIIVGGTGLYVDSLVNAIEYDDSEIDLEYRNKLDIIAEEKGLEVLYKKAVKIDPAAMEKISPNDKKRIFRVLEIYNATGKTKTEQEIESRKKENPYEFIIFAIDMDREKLYERINKRVDIMMENGLVDEVKSLINKYQEIPTAIQGLGYKEVVSYLNNELTYEEMVEKIKQETRRYAKRQLTWFRRNKQITWLNGLDDMQNNLKIILEGVKGEKKD
ncbi:MAG: tRNA (adenosine(37)-N6)-dimethylallyltransferase MiaA [Clostridia bacterium]|nr:tRNA (adenosine(37)-N6)-dimethylallyltransferase MiaA [Clostridia bacterium]